MKSLALGAIRFYQRFLSPRKGFCCAYAAIKGHGSCSVLDYRAIRRYGVWRGIAVLDKRLEKCGVVYRCQQHRVAQGMLSRQAGFLDCACNAPAVCDFPRGGLAGCENPHTCSNLMCCGYSRRPYSGIMLALAVDLLRTALRHGKASGDDQAIDVGTGLSKRTALASASSWPPVYGSAQLHFLGGRLIC